MKVILTGEYTEGDSIQIYTENIMDNFSEDINIIDKRIKIYKLTNSNISIFKKLKTTFTKIYKTVKSIRNIMRDNKGDSVVLVSQTGYFLYKLLFIKNKAVIVHDIFYLDYYKKEKNIIKKIIYYILFNLGHSFFLNKYKYIIAISEKTKEDLVSVGIDESKITIIHNGISHDLYMYNKDIKKENIILCVGMEYPRKNLERSIKSFEKIKEKKPNHTLIKVGGFSDSIDRKRVIKYIQQNTNLEIGKDIVFTNMIEKKEVRDYYQKAKVLLFPSLKEGFGFPIIEAMACGCVVITSDLGPMNTLVPYKELLVDPNRVEEIVTVLDTILGLDETQYNQYLNQGVSFSKKYNRKTTAEKIEILFFNGYPDIWCAHR